MNRYARDGASWADQGGGPKHPGLS